MRLWHLATSGEIGDPIQKLRVFGKIREGQHWALCKQGEARKGVLQLPYISRPVVAGEDGQDVGIHFEGPHALLAGVLFHEVIDEER